MGNDVGQVLLSKCINIPYPYGTFLSKRISNALVLSVKRKLDKEIFGVLENNFLLALAIFDSPLEVKRKDFQRYFGSHKITGPDRDRLWPKTKTFHIYKVNALFVAVDKIRIDYDRMKIFHELDLPKNTILVSA